MATKKKIDPQKKLLITAIKKCVAANAILPILEDVHFTGEQAVVTDLETSVVVPFYLNGLAPGGVCINNKEIIDILEMMENPVVSQQVGKEPQKFLHNGKWYAGSLDEYRSAWEEAVGEQNCKLELDQYIEEYAEAPTPAFDPAVTFSEGKRTLKITGENPINFPLIPMFNTESKGAIKEIGRLSSGDMEKLATALCFVSKDDLRPAMTGVFFDNDRMVSTDAHRLYWDNLSQPVTDDFILPAKTAKILLAFGGEWDITTEEVYRKNNEEKIVMKQPTKIEQRPVPSFKSEGIFYKGTLEEASKKYHYEVEEYGLEYTLEAWIQRYCKVCEDPNEIVDVEVPDETKTPHPVLMPISNISFTRKDGIKIITRVIDARYPDYRAVIPEGEGYIHAVVNPDELSMEIKNAMKFANKSTNMVVLGMNGSFTIAAQEIDFGKEYQNTLELAEFKFLDTFPEVLTYNGEEVKIVNDYGSIVEIRTDSNYTARQVKRSDLVAKPKELYIGFSGIYLQEIVSKLSAKPIEFKFWGPAKCTIINDHFLLMPLLLNNN